MSFMARSMRITVYGLFVSGFTHLSATIVAMSLNICSSCVCRSLSDTCSSPFDRICSVQTTKPVNKHHRLDRRATTSPTLLNLTAAQTVWLDRTCRRRTTVLIKYFRRNTHHSNNSNEKRRFYSNSHHPQFTRRTRNTGLFSTPN